MPAYFNKSVQELSLSDLQSLVVDQVSEGKNIEYKRQMYRLDGDDLDYRRKQHEELLKDVSSFANTDGGYLVIGVKEENGIPKDISGCECGDPDNLLLRLDAIINRWIEPMIRCVIGYVNVKDSNWVIVIHIYPSQLAPHRVVYQGKYGSFWARNSAGAYEMDTSELRHAFLRSETINEQIKKFRRDRISAIHSGEAPVPLMAGGKAIIHIVPIDSFGSRVSIPVAELNVIAKSQLLMGRAPSSATRVNIDGVVKHDGVLSPCNAGSYVQFFRSGVIEDVMCRIVFEQRGLYHFDTFVQLYMMEVFKNRLDFLATLGIQTPVWYFVTLTGVKDAGIYGRWRGRITYPFDRDVLFLPEVEITDFRVDVVQTLRPIFDMIWNAAGYERSLSFDENGDWVDHVL